KVALPLGFSRHSCRLRPQMPRPLLCRCRLRASRRANEREHTGHTCGLSPVCSFEWRLRSCCLRKSCLHWRQYEEASEELTNVEFGKVETGCRRGRYESMDKE